MQCEFCSSREATFTNVPTLFGLHTNLCSTCHQQFERTQEFPRPTGRRRRSRRVTPLPGQMEFDFQQGGGHGLAALEL